MPQILPLDPSNYQRHALHGENRIWAETNCYSDVIIELLHGMGLEPLAALPFTLTIDFDVDQWTFFKFPHEDIATLYGLGIYELAPWQPLIKHLHEQLLAGRPVLVELDSFFLPDTAGTAYQMAHVKSTVAVNAIDLEQGTLGYFHNQGYYQLKGQDFIDIFQTDGLVHPRMLPPYIEFVKKLPRAQALRGPALLEASLGVLKKRLHELPSTNPFLSFKEAFLRDQDWLLKSEMAVFHAYSFATLRQYGACFELSASYLNWLREQGLETVTPARDAFLHISQSTKALQLKLARAIIRKRPLEATVLDDMVAHWEQGMNDLQRIFGA